MNAPAGAIEAIAAAASPAGGMELLGGGALPRPGLDRVAIRGWSFGGFLAAAGADQQERHRLLGVNTSSSTRANVGQLTVKNNRFIPTGDPTCPTCAAGQASPGRDQAAFRSAS